MDNNHFSKNSISHKDLQAFLIKAKKDISSNNSSENINTNESEYFDELIEKWTDTSQQILKLMNTQENVITKNRNSKSLMAFGAMGAHINMALQALKATRYD